MEAPTEYLIHHLAFPAKLPRGDDSDPTDEQAILDSTINSLEILRNSFHDDAEIAHQISSVAASIANLKKSRDDHGYICKTQLNSLFHQLVEGVQGAAIPLEIKAQNAGVVISKGNDSILFEIFELLPSDEAVFSSQGRLIRTFPTHAYQVPIQDFLHNGLASALSDTLATMSTEEAKEFLPRTSTREISHIEVHDSAHPFLVTEFLPQFLRTVGSCTKAFAIIKHTREDVLCSTNTSSPWRRSPLWLLVRVTMQLGLLRTGSNSKQSTVLYKIAMIYVLANLLDTALESCGMFEADLIHNLSAKIACRLNKLKQFQNEIIYTRCSEFAQKILTQASHRMELLWKASIASSDASLDLERVSCLQPTEDLMIDIPALEDFIEEIPGRNKRFRKTKFVPSASFTSYKDKSLPNKFDAKPEYKCFQLKGFEHWVENHLPSWIITHAKTDQDACRKLGVSIKAYYEAANEEYNTSSSCPVNRSIMYLTTMELWVALDTCACCKLSLLRKYDPEIDIKPLQTLKLQTRSQLRRLAAIEEHVQDRRNNAGPDLPSIFGQFGHPLSFAARYSEQSKTHQQLKEQIEQKAEEERNQKRQEFKKKQEEYDRYMLDASLLDCRKDAVTHEHSSSCRKCELRNQAASLRIEAQEWPLSSDDNKAKAFVFELSAPEAFTNWRDITLFMMVTVLAYNGGSANKTQTPHVLKYPKGLNPTPIPKDQRIVLVSTVKPTQKGRRLCFSDGLLTEDQIFTENKLVCSYYDRERSVFTTHFNSSNHIQKSCAYRLSDRSSHLQKYLEAGDIANKLTPNAVVATLSDCPSHMTLNEYKAFCDLPMGYGIRYLRILCQISMPSIDFTQPEAQSIILSMILEAGPPSDDGTSDRATLWLLHNTAFLEVFIDRISTVIAKVESSWESSRILAIHVQLALRAIEFAEPDRQLFDRYIDFLQEARTTAFDWLEVLQDKLRKTRDQNERAELSSRATEAALICISTFDVDGALLPFVLASATQAKIYFRSSIAINQNQATSHPDDNFLYHCMLESYKRVLFRVFATIRHKFSSDEFQIGLNDTMESLYDGFEHGTWSELDAPYNHWLKVNSHCSQEDSVEVHYNLLTAEVLVDDSPLARLPKEYTDHDVYVSLFQGMPVQATLSNEAGMKYSIKHCDDSMTIHFLRIRNEPDLFVAVKHGNLKFDLVPGRVFADILPTAFVEDYYHWFSHESHDIVFRQKAMPWPSNEDSWLLKKSGSSWQLVKQNKLLVNPKTRTGKVISSIFSRLEHQSHIHTLLEEETSTVTIELPRLHIDFSFSPGQSAVRCRQYSGMIIDHDQQTGTLIGLENKLVLKHAIRPNDRIVLIPEGLVTWKRDSNDALRVSVVPDATSKIHAYRIDVILRYLADNGTLHSKLYLCYLHATTSHCLPDPLTAHRGTESALSILRSAAMFSSNILDKQNIKLLQRIAKLTPARNYRPLNQKVMQCVQWDATLPSGSQHPDFLSATEAILGKVREQKMFSKDTPFESGKASFSNHDLVQRDRIRTSAFHVDGFGAEHHTCEKDSTYEGRTGLTQDRTVRSFITSTLMSRGSFTLHSPVSAEALGQSIRQTHSAQDAQVHCAATKPNPYMFKFTVKLLAGPSSIFPTSWLDIYRSLTEQRHIYNKFDVILWLSALAYAESADMNIIQTLASFYCLPKKFWVKSLPTASFRLLSATPTVEDVSRIVQKGKRALEECPEDKIPQNQKEQTGNWARRKRRKFDKNQQEVVTGFSRALFDEGLLKKTTLLTIPTVPQRDIYLDIQRTMGPLNEYFTKWGENDSFYRHIHEIGAVLENQQVIEVQVPSIQHIDDVEQFQTKERPRGYRIQDIFQLDVPAALITHPSPILPDMTPSEDIPPEQNLVAENRLKSLCESLMAKAKAPYEISYITEMVGSLHSLLNLDSSPLAFKQEAMEDLHADIVMEDSSEVIMHGCSEGIIRKYAFDVEEYFNHLNKMLEQVVGSFNDFAQLTSQLPRISPRFWLQQLHRKHFDKLSEDWKTIIIKFGLAVTELSRANRLLMIFSTHQNQEALAEELRNVGHENWDPKVFPEVLLLEAENGLIVRKVQMEVSKEMMYPSNEQNVAMQLNMGEGKSSVIIPIVASALSDGNMLVRVVCGKAQFSQMRQTLIAKLGGLLNRRVYQLPFSRALKLTATEASTIYDICNECRMTGGILLIQPEQILAFRLMGLESIIAGHDDVGQSLLTIQRLFNDFARDIVDECDEAFSVRSDVAFTIGQQKTIEMGAERWGLIHEIMSLVSQFSQEVKKAMPSSIEIDGRGGLRLPRVRILRDDAGDMLLDLVAKAILKKGLPGIPVHQQCKSTGELIYKYIRNLEITLHEVEAVEKSEMWSCRTRAALSLIRGLIAGGVLMFTLRSKRWRVNYGADAHHIPKTRLAVPYRSKDQPSPRSEFSHPDVAILLTTLHYYNEGLSGEELSEVFTHLFKSDDPESEYKTWTGGVDTLPLKHRSLSGINFMDRYECTHEIFPKFRYSKDTIDYFLANLVFAKDMKEYPAKLSASGWDLGAFKSYPTTGFSGTADSKYLLPLNMDFLHLEGQNHTNALVLTHILRSENTVELVPPLQRSSYHTSEALHLLDFVNNMQQETRVIIDVGAQVLELDNGEVAEAWLNKNHSAKAAVYFHGQELVVRDRQGRIEPLQESAFSTELGDCLVYLDEAHTRGTDLKLPQDYRAAVFLGANLTKDAFVQACMRLRKLGKGQSIAICLNEEIQARVRQLVSKQVTDQLQVSDVLSWVISESNADLQRSMPLWANQGYRFAWQSKLWKKFGNETTLSKEQAEKFQEEETKTIENRYAPRVGDRSIGPVEFSGDPILEGILQRCQDFQAYSIGTMNLGEEQERELNPEAEIEEERYIEKPQNMEYAAHKLSRDVVRLVEKAKIRADSKDLLPAFQALGWENIPKQFPTSLLVTKDFICSIKTPAGQSAACSDSYMKPVQFLLSIKEKNNEKQDQKILNRRLIIISPFEAEKLLPKIRESNSAILHLYAPRTNIAYTPLDALDLYCVGGGSFLPKEIDISDTLQLNLFAGQLYFKRYQDYCALCTYLGLASKPGDERHKEADGFMKGKENRWFLKQSPVEFLLRLVNMRREGEGLGRTHIAKMLRGVLLERKDFER